MPTPPAITVARTVVWTAVGGILVAAGVAKLISGGGGRSAAPR